jgi:hypothetical protein
MTGIPQLARRQATDHSLFVTLGLRRTAGTTLALLTLWTGVAGASDSGQFFLRTSTHVVVGNVLRVGISSDGINFNDLFLKPTLTNYSRDASVAKHGSNYVVAYTDQFTSSNGTFGVAVSSNLVNWSQIATPKAVNTNLITNGINNTWAPEWFVEAGSYYVVVRVSLTTNGIPSERDTLRAPGHGYMQCLDPGTWTNWTEFQPIGGFTNANANDVAIAKFGDTYHLFYTDQGDLMVRRSTEGPVGGYGAASNISSTFEDIVDAGEKAFGSFVYRPFPFEGPFVVHLGGNDYRLYFQNLINDRTWTVLSTNGMAGWDTNSIQPVTYNGSNSFGHGSVMKIGGPETLLALAGSRVRAENALTENVNIRANPNAYGLYSALQFTNNRQAGQADVIGSPRTFGLFDSNSIMDLNLGGVMLQKEETSVLVNLQVLTSTDLSQGFTNHPASISFPVELPGNKHFLRLRALGPR